MNILTFLLFATSAIGMTHIIVDSTLFSVPREWLRKRLPESVFEVFTCYQCMGFWVGLFCGWAILSTSLLTIFLAGCASSFLSSWGAYYLNYLESRSVVG